MDNRKPSKKINLIPAEMAVPARAVKVAKVINNISLVGVVVLILSIVVIGGLFFYFNSENDNLVNSISSLKSRIVSLEQNEQKLVLAKDRISKINIVQKLKSVSGEVGRFKKFSEIVASVPGAVISEANLTSKGSEVSLLAQSTDSLSGILVPLASLDEYRRITLSSLGYNPNSGYILTILLETE